ncbi:peptide-methionine (R)-S-oxide reductase [Candidatus Pacearchaeota archaeon CG10_big_fil_rev_8_21_14_0_10_34_76]|nr:MAG: peptide-methionine (R)-S-oxide reductase [Candidatus Pacearchaeota archaeon CG10_big_fil_rev_8_21_14_0_10_34_76]
MKEEESGKIWKNKLTPEQYFLLREKGTEPPFSGKLLNNKEGGMYLCAACGNHLFDSDVKFDSGTGWPSFYDAKPGAIKFQDDNKLGMTRIEVICAKCGSHLGHIFDDGPKDKTGKRYCINSSCLDFRKN